MAQKPETTSIKDALKDPPKQENPKKAKAEIQIFREQFTVYEKTLMRLCTEENKMKYDKFMAVAENAVRKNPKLLEADRATLFGAILTAAELGLEPNTPAQLSFMIPYWNSERQISEVNFQIGYHGYVDLMFRHPRVKKVTAELVYDQDKFRRWMDDQMHWRFEFEPATDGMRGARKGVFAIVHLEGVDPAFTYLPKDKIEEIKMKSKSPQVYEPENDPEGWMWRKAAVRQVAKLVPKGTPALNKGINIDGMIEAGASVVVADDGKVVIQKMEKEAVSKEKLKIVFGDPAIQDADIVDPEPEENG